MSLDFSLYAMRFTEIFSENYTHNAVPMAEAAGIYKALWRPSENHYVYAGDIIPVLLRGIKDMQANPDKYIALEPKNGWGRYETFLSFVRDVLSACEANPDAEIKATR